MTKSLRKIFAFIFSSLLLISGVAIAQSDQSTAVKPPISQPLVREGDFAVKLADALKLGPTTNETEAESLLGTAGVAPRNGWIADYPVTPDILGELQASVNLAANSGKFAMGTDAALKAMQDVMAGYNLAIRTEAAAPQSGSAPAGSYPDTPVINNYYYDEGPPVVTYYSPPPDYAYMYTWVPYPFWWWNFWYPGYFVLVDFHVRVHEHERGDRDVFISNHYRDTRTGNVFRIDPANRSRGMTMPAREGARLSSPSARSGAQAIVRGSEGRVSSGASRVFRGYGERPSAGSRPSAFDRSRNSQFDRAASDRGFISRSEAGRVGTGRVEEGRVLERGATERGVSRGVLRGNKRGDSGDDGGGFHGGGRR